MAVNGQQQPTFFTRVIEYEDTIREIEGRGQVFQTPGKSAGNILSWYGMATAIDPFMDTSETQGNAFDA